MATVIRNWTRLRDIVVGVDPAVDGDWVVTNNISAWRQYGNPRPWGPSDSKLGGRIQLKTVFYDSASIIVPPLLNTRIDLELVELVEVDDNSISPHLVTRGFLKQIAGDTIFEDPDRLSFQSVLGVRLVASQNLPTSVKYSVLGRVL